MTEPDDPAATTHLEPLEPEDEPADDSGVEEAADDVLSTASLPSIIFRYREEHGRTYTTYGSGEYLLPNDEQEQKRLDMTHHLWNLVGDDKLYQTPEREWKRILDAGTGTGIWAIDIADKHPEATVIGVDLSPIQPGWLPPNCQFEVDDLEEEWTFRHPFSLMFFRSMIASFKDWSFVLKQAFEHLEPGGCIEIQDNVYPLASDDNTITGTNILRWSELMVQAADKIGRPITVAPYFKSMLADAGFIDIVATRKKIPTGTWPKDPHYKELGIWSRLILLEGIEGISLGLLEKLGLTVDEIHVLLAEVRNDLSNTRIHGYWDTYLVYAKKPQNAAG